MIQNETFINEKDAKVLKDQYGIIRLNIKFTQKSVFLRSMKW